MPDPSDFGFQSGLGPKFVPEGLSRLHFYSYGIVAKNKDLSSDLIEVVPSEDQSFLDGELTDNIEKIPAYVRASQEALLSEIYVGSFKFCEQSINRVKIFFIVALHVFIVSNANQDQTQI